MSSSSSHDSILLSILGVKLVPWIDWIGRFTYSAAILFYMISSFTLHHSHSDIFISYCWIGLLLCTTTTAADTQGHPSIWMIYQLCASVLLSSVPALPWRESIPWITSMSPVLGVTPLGLVIQYSGLGWLKPTQIGGNLGTRSSVCVARKMLPWFVMNSANA